MGIRKIAMVAALGASLASAPVMAQSSQASSLSVATAQRSGAELQEANQQLDTQAYVIGFFVIVAIGLGLYFALDDSDEGPISA
jgi:uncharacterized membrane protein